MGKGHQVSEALAQRAAMDDAKRLYDKRRKSDPELKKHRLKTKAVKH